MGPRDTPTQWGVPVNPFTGQPIGDQQRVHLDAIQAAVSALAVALHDAEGSSVDNFGYQTRRMSIAGTHLEELHLMAWREVLDR